MKAKTTERISSAVEDGADGRATSAGGQDGPRGADGGEQGAVSAAARGNRDAFDRLARVALPKLRATVRRMVGHPEQVNDVVQDALARAWSSIGSFDGRAAFSTWLCRIGINQAIDFLRGQARWRERAQVAYANECAASAELGMEVGGVLMALSFHFDAKEHVAFCFTCVGRSLEPEQQAALLLREVDDLTNLEAARTLGVSESVFRHRLTAARDAMTRAFDGLCSLVNKDGVCYQCRGLREAIPDAARQGEPPPEPLPLKHRLQVVRACDTDAGRGQAMHDLFWRRIAELEREGRGATEPSEACAPENTPLNEPASS